MAGTRWPDHAPVRGAGDVLPQRSAEGRLAYSAGAAAEASVAIVYDRCGLGIVHRRWRGLAGEIDLIVRDGDDFVFVEVKKARSLEAAALRLGRRQMDRIIAAACEFLGTQPGGLLAGMRFDLALVDALGRVRIIESAFGET